MKKYFSFIVAVATMFSVTSCSQEDVISESSQDYVSAKFTIGTTDAMGSRAIGDGETVNTVACAVFDANGTEMKELRKYKPVVGKEATYEVRLVKGQAYRVAFFAYDNTANAYDVTDMKSIKVLGNQASNMENRDAFTNYIDIEAAKTVNTIEEDVTLYRPFAQLNLGIDDTELDDARKAGVVVANTQITVTNVYNAFSAFDNEIAADATLGEMTFAFNGMPQQKLTVNGTDYNYLAMNYLLVGDQGDEKGLADIEFVWNTADGKTNNPTAHFINIPVQRNYRTNIIGKLLTNPATFNISIDADFEEPDYVEEVVSVVTKNVDNYADLQAAIDNATEGQTIIKLDGISGGVTNIVVNQKKNVEILIDGQGNPFPGTFTVNGASVWGGTEGLTLQNIYFMGVIGEDNYVTVGKNVAGNMSRYAHNVIIKDCEFAPIMNLGTDKTVAVRAYQANDLLVMNCKASRLHSFAQITGGNNVKFEGIISSCIRGISLGSATNSVVANCNIKATGSDKYGIRHNADSANDELKISGTTVNAFIPVVVRKTNNTAIESYKLSFEGTNTLTKGGEYEVAIANEEYDAVGKTLTALPNVTVAGAGECSIFQ